MKRIPYGVAVKELSRFLLLGFFILSPFFWRGLGGEASAQVNADFIGSTTSGCGSVCVNFTDKSTGSPTTWNWNFGDGSTATIKNPQHCYVTAKTYTVTLTASKQGSTDTEVKKNYITVYNNPTAGFTMSTDTSCIGRTITFTDATTISSGGSPIGTWDWNFGDGTNTTTTAPIIPHTYSLPNTYPVDVIATDGNNCNSHAHHDVTILPAPTASFSATPTSACVPPLNVSFTNTSSSIGKITYTWRFGDGSAPLTTNSPSHTYTASGTYNVTLIINQNGCIDSIVKPNYITIQNVVADFITPALACTGQAAMFNNTTTPVGTTSKWDFGDAGVSTLTSPSHSYAAAGTYTVTLISSKGNCTDTATKTVAVNLTPVASFSATPTSSCSAPLTVNFTDLSTGGTNYNWTFGDGTPNSTAQNPSHTYTSPGIYSVTLLVSDSITQCSHTLVKNNYIIISPPVANFTAAPKIGCTPLPVNFISTSSSLIDPIKSYIWNFGDGPNDTISTPGTAHTYTAAANYAVTLTVTTTSGCTNVSSSQLILVGQPPIAKFGIVEDTVCFNSPVNFLDSSTGPVTNWRWVFDDGQFSSSQNPSHVYGDTGTFHPYLVAINNGCRDTAMAQKVVILPPQALFTYTLSCTDYYTVGFTSTSIGADSIVWKFGDGTMDSSNTISPPPHTYPSRGVFTVKLIAYNFTTGCADSITQTFTIAEPKASFTTANKIGCYPFLAQFNSTSSQDRNTVTWNFGDLSSGINNTSTVYNPSHTYNAPGTYYVYLVIRDVNLCPDTSTTDTLHALGPRPYFYADKLNGCSPLLVTFTDTSISDSALVQWTWNFGDGSPTVITRNNFISHTYTTPSSYAVTMTVKDTSYGCSATLSKSSYIRPTYPYPAFTTSKKFACVGNVITFNASATSAATPKYTWNFGEGKPDTSTNANPIITHVYTRDSLYTVTLTVQDINLCDSTITDTVRVLTPKADFGWSLDTLYCGNMEIAFHDSSTGFANSWQWDFGNGGTSILQNPIAFYFTGGVYDVQLIVKNAGGCIDTMRKDSLIKVPLPAGTFTFTPTSGCNPLTVCFDVKDINTEFNIWDFDNGYTQQVVGDLCYTYTSARTYTPKCFSTTTLPNGRTCTVEDINLTGSVTVINVIDVSINGPSLTAPPYVVHVPIDSIISISARPTGGVAPYTYNWSPNTGINCDSCGSIMILGTGDTILYLLTVYDTAGCVGRDSILILSEACFQPKRIPNVFSPNGDGMNDMFYIPGVCPNEKYSLQIFDRWGVLMFSTSMRNNGWDGRTNAGVEVPNGVYYFIVTLEGQLDRMGNHLENSSYKGFVQLVR
ncbi:MAG: PKD domain-containing protein [Bacteroidetes bacterium]|nr:PKD domain-containing protein [Bacteroidota bacterium]